jgi:hypothetical protein
VILGFTGTREGMTPPQREAFRRTVSAFFVTEFHHGDCIGSDAEAHADVRLCWPSAPIVIHPPVDVAHRAYCTGDVLLEPRTHFARNRAIVCAADVVVGASLTPMRTERGGTWYTLDYAFKLGKLVQVHWPDGSVTPHPDDVRP